MRKDKKARILSAMTCHKGTSTVSHVLSTIINDTDIARLPGKVIGKIANIRHSAYLEGKKEGIDKIDDCIWHNDKLIPLCVLDSLQISETTSVRTIKSDNPRHSYNFHTIYKDEELSDRIFDRLDAEYMTQRGEPCYYSETTKQRKYTIDYVENF